MRHFQVAILDVKQMLLREFNFFGVSETTSELTHISMGCSVLPDVWISEIDPYMYGIVYKPVGSIEEIRDKF